MLITLLEIGRGKRRRSSKRSNEEDAFPFSLVAPDYICALTVIPSLPVRKRIWSYEGGLTNCATGTVRNTCINCCGVWTRKAPWSCTRAIGRECNEPSKYSCKQGPHCQNKSMRDQNR